MYSNEVRVLRPKLWGPIGFALMFLILFVICAVKMGHDKGSYWILAVMTGIGFTGSIASMFPNASYLRLAPESFTLCSMFWVHHFCRQDIVEFSVKEGFLYKTVAFRYSPSYQTSPNLLAMYGGLRQFEGAFPETYGLAPASLVALLNQYKVSSVSHVA